MKREFGILLLSCLAAGSVRANAYTNLAGNAITGVPVSITPVTVTLTNADEKAVYRLAIFSADEKRRLAADAGSTQFVPTKIRLALEGVAKAMARSRKRAEKGFCTKVQSDVFCAREVERMRAYLAHEEAEGRLLSAERRLLGQ